MGTVNNLFSSAAATDTSSSSSSSTSSSSDANGLANEQTFLQLLVAQLKNQNPAQPMDGTTFVTQLAQFSELEQSLASRQDLDAIASKYAPTSTPSTSNDNSQQQNSSTGT